MIQWCNWLYCVGIPRQRDLYTWGLLNIDLYDVRCYRTVSCWCSLLRFAFSLFPHVTSEYERCFLKYRPRFRYCMVQQIILTSWIKVENSSYKKKKKKALRYFKSFTKVNNTRREKSTLKISIFQSHPRNQKAELFNLANLVQIEHWTFSRLIYISNLETFCFRYE